MPESPTAGTVGRVIAIAAATSVVVSLSLILILGPASEEESRQVRPSLASESVRKSGSSDSALAELREALERERAARLFLARQIEDLREELARSGAENSSPDGDARAGVRVRPNAVRKLSQDTESEFAELWFSEQALSDAGLSAIESRRLRGLFDEVELEKLEARDRALREGWVSSSRHSRELRDIRDRFREDIGDENYDRVLYTSGRKNRVRVSDLLHGSAAEESGVEVGDLIVRYAGPGMGQ